mgnify:CR=1 FL=1
MNLSLSNIRDFTMFVDIHLENEDTRNNFDDPLKKLKA